MSKKKVAIYTCVTGGYDTISKLNEIDADVDYICFNDGNVVVPEPWVDVRLSLHLNEKDLNRHVKILPHLYPQLAGCDLLIYVDGSVSIVGSIVDFCSEILAREGSFFVFDHPNRKCAYAESIACLESKKASLLEVRCAIMTMKQMALPEAFGLFECGVIARKNIPNLIEFSNKWWRYYNTVIKRDQIALMLTAWELKYSIISLGQPDHRFGHRYFKCSDGHKGDYLHRCVAWHIWRPGIKFLRRVNFLKI
jgi:hypothetical protein